MIEVPIYKAQKLHSDEEVIGHVITLPTIIDRCTYNILNGKV